MQLLLGHSGLLVAVVTEEAVELEADLLPDSVSSHGTAASSLGAADSRFRSLAPLFASSVSMTTAFQISRGKPAFICWDPLRSAAMPGSIGQGSEVSAQARCCEQRSVVSVEAERRVSLETEAGHSRSPEGSHRPPAALPDRKRCLLNKKEVTLASPPRGVSFLTGCFYRLIPNEIPDL